MIHRHGQPGKSLILTPDDELGQHLRGLSTARQVTALLRGAVPAPTEPDTDITLRRAHLAELAADIRTLDRRLHANDKQLTTLIEAIMPSLLGICGIGPVTAAVLLTTWSHHSSCSTEAAYAASPARTPSQPAACSTTRTG